MKYFFLVLVSTAAILAFTQTHATKFYKHIPFTTFIGTSDIVVVNYDIEEKNGIVCISTHHKLWIDFVYKGRQKSAYLPVILENTHVPEKKQEELADSNGQFNLLISKSNMDNNGQYEVSCDYVIEK